MQMYRTAPAQITADYVLSPEVGWWSVITPEATTNLIINPSFELDLAGYSAGTTEWLVAAGTTRTIAAATTETACGTVLLYGSLVLDGTLVLDDTCDITRVSDDQRRGVYSALVSVSNSPYAGVSYEIDLTAGTTYAFSADVLGATNVPYRLQIVDTSAGTVIASHQFRGRGRWRRPWCVGRAVTTGAHLLIISKDNSLSTRSFRIDGLQVEAKAYPTTYTDGDQRGLVRNQIAYLWTGTPHASTSTRSAQTRAGGRVVCFDTFGFRVISQIGLGVMPLSNISTPLGLLGGALYQRTIPQVRPFTIVGDFGEAGHQHISRNRQGLIDALAPSRMAIQQPLVLRYQARACDDDYGDELDIVCLYAGGLEGATSNLFSERVPLQFTSYLPSITEDGNDASVLNASRDVASVSYIAQRSPTGEWDALGTVAGGAPTVRALTQGGDGTLYVGGDFLTIDGAGGFIAQRQSGVWSSMGSGAASQVLAIVIGPDGTLYAGGTFSDMDGVGNTRGIARWDGSAWHAVGSGVGVGTVRSLAIGPNGTLYAGGDFTSIGGVTVTGIARWNGSAWSALVSGTSVGGTVYALDVGLDGTVYAGGTFTTIGGVTVANIARWTGSAWTALGAGMDNLVLALAVGLNGTLYAGGAFTTADGNPASAVAAWDGGRWSPLSTGLTGVSPTVFTLTVDPGDGSLYAGGSLFATAGGVPLPDALARWTGSAWTPLDANLPGSAVVEALLIAPDGTLTVGFSTTGTLTGAYVTTVDNLGTEPAAPRIRLTGPGRVYQLVNTTSGAAIYFDLLLNAGEVAVLDLTPGVLSFTSSFRGNILGTILPGSNTGTWTLLPGDNTISLFLTGSSNPAAATMEWDVTHASVDASVPR